MLYKSILAGLMISIGAIVNLTVGPPLGAFIFSVGLMAILIFDLYLFTGKAGLLATKEISLINLGAVWIGNLFGCGLGVGIAVSLPQYSSILASATAIAETRNSNTFIENFVLGIACGLLMYIAVNAYKKTGSILSFMLPVAVFILSGYNHCVADMFYLTLAGGGPITATTLGNIVGCNLIPYLSSLHHTS